MAMGWGPYPLAVDHLVSMGLPGLCSNTNNIDTAKQIYAIQDIQNGFRH